MLCLPTRIFCVAALLFVLPPLGCTSADAPSRRDPSTEVTATEGHSAAPGVGQSIGASSSREARPDDWFEEVAGPLGVQFTYRNGRDTGHDWVVETIGGGVAMIDYDQDDDLDLFFAGGGKVDGDPPRVSGLPCALHRNDGAWRFVEVTEDAGLGHADDFSFGVA
ncbi:MAG: hypothetical protein ABI614_05160, partial [Planctomycetota bacterium]